MPLPAHAASPMLQAFQSSSESDVLTPPGSPRQLTSSTMHCNDNLRFPEECRSASHLVVLLPVSGDRPQELLRDAEALDQLLRQRRQLLDQRPRHLCESAAHQISPVLHISAAMCLLRATRMVLRQHGSKH